MDPKEISSGVSGGATTNGTGKSSDEKKDEGRTSTPDRDQKWPCSVKLSATPEARDADPNMEPEVCASAIIFSNRSYCDFSVEICSSK
jgi:hypothetical protein